MGIFYYRPMKKKGGTLAGIPRASGERNSPVNGVFGNQVSHHFFFYHQTPHLVITSVLSCIYLYAMSSDAFGVLSSSMGEELILPVSVACEKSKRQGGNLFTAFRFYRTPQAFHPHPVVKTRHLVPIWASAFCFLIQIQMLTHIIRTRVTTTARHAEVMAT